MTIQQNYPAIKPTLNLDFANTKQLDPRITYSRASTGTYYDGKTRAKAEENLLLYSQFIGNGPFWTNTGSYITLALNAFAAPDGTTTATSLTVANTTDPTIYQVFSAAVSNLTYSASVYVLGTGASVGKNVSLQYYDNGTRFIQNVTLTASWQRVTLTFTKGASSANQSFGVILNGASAPPSNANLAVGDVCYIWGAQLEQRSFATAYTPTTTAPITNYIPVLQTASAGTPRFDHNPITGESFGLLIEEQRTNLFKYSETFDASAWNKFQSATITANATTAPDGTSTADLLTWGTGGASGIYQAVSSAFVSSMSVYAKTYSGSPVLLVGDDSGSRFAHFNLATGAPVATVGTSSTSITPVGNGWYKLVVVFATSPSGIKFISGTGTVGSAYIWGAQLEAGAFATSYIPTVASQVTRAADSASITGANFSSWYSNANATFYLETTPSSVSRPFFNANDNSGTNSILPYLGTSGSLNVFSSSSAGTQQIDLAGNFINQSTKIAFALTTGSSGASINGGTVFTGTVKTMPQCTQLTIGTSIGVAGTMTATIKKLAYYPIRCTNTQLQALTS